MCSYIDFFYFYNLCDDCENRRLIVYYVAINSNIMHVGMANCLTFISFCECRVVSVGQFAYTILRHTYAKFMDFYFLIMTVSILIFLC